MTRQHIFNYSWSSVRLEIHKAWVYYNSTIERHVFDTKYKITLYDSKNSCWYYLSTRMGTLIFLRLWTRHLNDDALCIVPYNLPSCGFDYIQFDTLDELQQYINKEAMVEAL